jgi:hypothetical protein
MKTWKPLVAISASIILVSCTTTVTPEKVKAVSVRYDGNQRDAGFKGYLADGCGVISSNAVARYNALIAEYGSTFKPPLTTNYGLQCCYTNGTSLITKEALVYFGLMSDMERSKQK